MDLRLKRDALERVGGINGAELCATLLTAFNGFGDGGAFTTVGKDVFCLKKNYE